MDHDFSIANGKELLPEGCELAPPAHRSSASWSVPVGAGAPNQTENPKRKRIKTSKDF